MRINTQLRAISVVSIVVLLILAPVLIWFFAEFTKAKADDVLLDKINENFFERVALRDQYFLYRESRAATQLDAKKEDAYLLLHEARGQFGQDGRQRILERLTKNVEDNAVIFQRIVDNTEKLKSSIDNHQVYEELDKRLFSQMLVKSVVFRDDLTNILVDSEQRVTQTYNYLVIYILFLFVVLTSVTILSSVHLSKLFRKRLAPLYDGAKLIAGGDFGHQIQSDGSDEFADLTTSINVMTSKLRSANQELETEIVERKKIETALLQSTILLHAEQQALKDAKDRISLAADSGGIGIWDWDLVAGVFMCDERLYRLYGLTHPDKLETLDVWVQRIHRDDQVRVGEELMTAIGGGKPYDTEFRNVWSDGSVHHIRATGRVTRDVAGLPLRMTGVNWDVTESRQLTAELVLARDAAEAANRAKSQFLANMSHEIRTPMNAILGMLQLLQHTELTTRQLDYAVKTQSAAKSLLSLLNDILDLSKVEADKFTLEHVPFRIDVLMRELSVIFASSVGSKDIEVLFSMDPKLPVCIAGDGLRLRQVLINLVGNAIKFTKQGEVVVSLDVLTHDSDSSEIVFSVRDSGIGIAPDQLPVIFDAFVQAEASTSRHFGGSGLGLAISHRLVSLMGGVLEAESTSGIGSCFHFALTFEHAAEDDDTSLPVPVKHRGPGPQRVLIVDDNACAREILLAMVVSLGWQGDVADSGQTALAMLRHDEPGQFPYDVVFMDWKMPEMDGWETTRRIRRMQHGNRTPVIVMVTAHGREILTERLHNESNFLNGFLVKPVTASMLSDAVIDASNEPVRIIARQRTKRLAGLRLLVVEDTLMNQQVARELLSNEGASVEVANDGRSGVAMTLAGDPPYDAVLMDIQMPDMDGYAATEKIRQDARMHTLPIIAMTANAMATDRAACRAAGMNDHIAKPIDLDDVVKTILRYCKSGSTNPIAAGTVIPAIAQVSDDNKPEIAFDDALRRLGGNKLLFTALAQRFGTDVSAMIADCQQYLAQGDMAKAAGVMHTLKGIAGTLGSVRLMTYAANTEVQLRAVGAAINADAIMPELTSLVSASTAALEAIALDLHSSQRAAEPGSALGDGAEFNAKLDELAVLLRQTNMGAMTVFTELQQKFGNALGSRLTTLAEAMNRLDFKLALMQCDKLRHGLL